jgi:hypothetical protein
LLWLTELYFVLGFVLFEVVEDHEGVDFDVFLEHGGGFFEGFGWDGEVGFGDEGYSGEVEGSGGEDEFEVVEFGLFDIEGFGDVLFDFDVIGGFLVEETHAGEGFESVVLAHGAEEVQPVWEEVHVVKVEFAGRSLAEGTGGFGSLCLVQGFLYCCL